MADEPDNRQMDRMLREYAAQRRAAPDPALHPATRRMLQDEVRRVHGAGSRPREGWLAWWPQIAFGCALVLIFGLTTAILRQSRQPASEMQLAKAESAQSEPFRRDGQQPSEPTRAGDEFKNVPGRAALLLHDQPGGPDLAYAPSAGKELPESRLGLYRTTESAAQNSETDAELAPDSAESVRRPSVTQARGNFPSLARSSNPASAADLSIAAARLEPAARTETLSRANELTNLGAAMRTRFVQTNLPPSPILQSFQLEQLGAEVRLIDLDGSVYAGERLGTAPGVAFTTNATYSFHATGQNLSLGVPVLIEASYFHGGGHAGTQSPAAIAPLRAVSRSSAAPTPKAAILGRAVISGTNEILIKAVAPER